MEPSPLATALLAAALAVIMFALGTTLRGEQFRLVFTQPRGVLIGMANLLFVAPLLAFGVAHVVSLDPWLAAGLVLLGAAPGGVFANLLTHAAGGATALSVSMTAISSTLAVVTVPLWLGIAVNEFGVQEQGAELHMPLVVARVLIGIAVPLAAGMWLASRRPEWVEARRRLLERIALATFGLIIVTAVVGQGESTLDHLGEVALACLLLNLLAMGVGFAAAASAVWIRRRPRRSPSSSACTTPPSRWRSAAPSTNASRSPRPSTAPSCSPQQAPSPGSCAATTWQRPNPRAGSTCVRDPPTPAPRRLSRGSTWCVRGTGAGGSVEGPSG